METTQIRESSSSTQDGERADPTAEGLILRDVDLTRLSCDGSVLPTLIYAVLPLHLRLHTTEIWSSNLRSSIVIFANGYARALSEALEDV